MKKIRALIWKEWREARLVFIAAVALTIFARLILLLCRGIAGFDYAWWMLVFGNFVLPLGFTLFGAFVFTNEITEKTEDFLFTRCVSKRTVFWIKYIFVFCMVVFLVAISYAIFYNPVLKVGPEQEKSPFMLFLALLPFVTGMYMLIVLSSLLTKKPLIAICSAPVLLLPLMLCSFPYTGMAIEVINNMEEGSDIMNVLRMNMLPLTLLVVLSILTIYLWETAVIKGKNIWIQFVKYYVILCFIVWGSHFALYLYSNYQVNAGIEKLKKSGLKWGWTDADSRQRKVLKKQLDALRMQGAILNDRYKKEKDFIYKLQSKTNDPNREKQIMLIYRKIFSDPGYDKYFRDANAFIKSLPKNALHSMNADEKYWGISTELRFSHWLNSYYWLLLAKTKLNIEDKKYVQVLSDIDVENQTPFSIGLGYFRQMSSGKYLDSLLLIDPLRELDKQTVEAMKKLCKAHYDIGDTGLQSEADDLYRWYESRIPQRFLNNQNKLQAFYHSEFFQGYICRPVISRIMIKKLRTLAGLKQVQNQPFYKVADKIAELQKPLNYSDLNFWRKYFFDRYLTNIYDLKNRRDFLELVAALKVYKAENKEYPAKLAELVPGILNELPYDPITGKQYSYKKRGDGFIVFSETESPRFRMFSQWKEGGKYYISIESKK